MNQPNTFDEYDLFCDCCADRQGLIRGLRIWLPAGVAMWALIIWGAWSAWAGITS